MSLVILNGNSTSSVLQNADLTLDNMTGRLQAKSTSQHVITRQDSSRLNSTLRLEKDLGVDLSDSDYDDKAVSLLFALTGEINDVEERKFQFQFKADNDAVDGKRMIMSQISDDGSTLTDIATFGPNEVDFDGAIIVGGSGSGLIESATDLEIDCSGNDLTITANEIFMDADGGTY